MPQYVPYSTIVMVKNCVFNNGPFMSNKPPYKAKHNKQPSISDKPYKAKQSKTLSENSSFYLESKLYEYNRDDL